MRTELSETLRATIDTHGQQHLLSGWDDLGSAVRRRLIGQLESIDFDELKTLIGQKESTDETRPARAGQPTALVRQPKTAEDEASWERAAEVGSQLLADGKVAVLLVAGGQGTRLGFPHPKGMYPIGPVSGNSLYQILAEQLLARSRRAGVTIPYFVMTSDATYDETVAFFRQHRFFGLPEQSVTFFRQGNMPAVDLTLAEQGELRILLDDSGQIAMSPNGHGGTLAALRDAGLIDRMKADGIEHIFYHQVDNPTAIVCDPAFLGWHVLKESDLTTKVVRKTGPEEKMGVLVDVGGSTEIIEYTELSPEQSAREDDDGDWVFWAGNTAVHAFGCAFLDRLINDPRLAIPYHQAKKKIPFLDDFGTRVVPGDDDPENGLKFERFIFDALPSADTALVIEADREREFNPVKNADGADSPTTARNALSRIAREWLQDVDAGITKDAPAEISPLFALDAKDVADRFRDGNLGRVFLTD